MACPTICKQVNLFSIKLKSEQVVECYFMKLTPKNVKLAALSVEHSANLFSIKLKSEQVVDL